MKGETLLRGLCYALVGAVTLGLGGAVLAGDASAEEERDFKKGCRQCHDELMSRWDLAAVAHFPYKAQKCDVCHAAEHKQFTAEKGKPCLICHDLGSEKIKAAHFSANVTGADCLICHYTHGSERKGLLKEFVHKPFAEGMCGSCHKAGAEGKMELLSEAKKICLVCHSDKAAKAGETLHPALEMSECTDCHTPHTSAHEKLLKEKESQICAGCHEDEHVVKHPVDVRPSPKIKAEGAGARLVDGEVTCTSCHNPHKAKGPFLLEGSTARGELCRACHEF